MVDNMINRMILINELNTLALRVNFLTPLCVFTRCHGHVDMVEFEICKSKENYDDKLLTEVVNYKRDTFEEIQQKHEKLKNTFHNLLQAETSLVHVVKIEAGPNNMSKEFLDKNDALAWVDNMQKQLRQEPIVTIDEVLRMENITGENLDAEFNN